MGWSDLIEQDNTSESPKWSSLVEAEPSFMDKAKGVISKGLSAFGQAEEATSQVAQEGGEAIKKWSEYIAPPSTEPQEEPLPPEWTSFKRKQLLERVGGVLKSAGKSLVDVGGQAVVTPIAYPMTLLAELGGLMFGGPEEAKRRGEIASKALVPQPTEPASQEITEVIGKGIEGATYPLRKYGKYLFGKTGEIVDTITGDKFDPNVLKELDKGKQAGEFIGERAGEVATFVAGFKLPKMIKKSNWYRELTIPERDMVVLSYQDMKNAGWAEGKILRNLSNKEQRAQMVGEAIERRRNVLPDEEPPTAPTPPIEPKPSGPVAPTGLLPEPPAPRTAPRGPTILPSGPTIEMGGPGELTPRVIPNESGVGLKVEYSRDGEVVGSGQLLGEDITNIIVEEPYRRQGIGSEIMKDLMERGGKSGYAGTEAGKGLMTKAGMEDLGGGRYGTKDAVRYGEEPVEELPEKVEPGQEPDVTPTEKSATISDRGQFPIQRVAVKDIQANPKELQFKLDVNAEGEQKPIAGEWNELASGNLLLWESKDGNIYVANGHHRLAKAKREKIENVNAQILKEVDGFTATDARRMAAEANVLEGKGTVYDHAEYFRLNQDYSSELAEKRGIAGRGYAIGKSASDYTYAKFRNRELSPEAAEAIVRTAPGNENLQEVGVKFVLSHPAASPLEVTNFIRAASIMKSAPSEQGNLFGFEEPTIKAAEQASKTVSKIIQDLREDLNAITGASKRPERAAKLGVNMDNPQEVKYRAAQLRNEIESWDKWYLDPEKVKLVEKGGPVGKEAMQGDLFDQAPAPETTGEALASVGTFNVGGGGGSSAPRPPNTPENIVSPMDLPEMVKFFNELTGGQYPIIMKKLRAFHGQAAGLYRTGQGKIELKADIFENPEQAKATLAHEIGHFLDDLPDSSLRQRGNILGRLASLKKYFKNYLEEFEGAPGPLTSQDKLRLMQEAREALKIEKADAEKETVEFKDIKLTPDDIKAIWTDVQARDKFKDVYNFIAGLSDVEKNQIVRQAMRGIVAESVQRQFRSIPDVANRPFKDWDQRLRDIFNDLLKEEIDKRRLFTKEQMMKELKDLSVYWKPFTPIPGSSFTKYRFSGAELYADAISVLFNDPGLLMEKTPHFYTAFFNYLHRKPEALRAYNEMQDLINSGEESILKDRQERVRESFKAGEEDLKNLMKPEPYNVLETLRTAFISKREPLLKLKRAALKRKEVIPADQDPDYLTEKLPYISGPIFQTIRDINNEVLKPSQEKGISQVDIGEYMKYRREATERAKLANPLGFTEADALKQMDFLKKQLGADKFQDLTDAVKKHWDIRSKNVIPILEKARMFNPDTMKQIKDNENYATWMVLEYLNKEYGPAISSHIYRQVGTLKEIANPFIATVIKDMSMLRAAERKMIADGVVKWLSQQGVGGWAEKKFNGKYQELVPSNDPKMGMITYLHEGKPTGYYVPKNLADIFGKDPYDFQPVLRIMSIIQRPFKELFVSKNPAWMVWNSMWRDPKALYKQIPGMGVADVWKYWFKSVPDSWKDVFGDASTPDVRALYEMKALHSGRIWNATDMGPETYLDKIVMSFGETPAKYENFVVKPYQKLWEYLKAGIDLLDKVGQVGERIPKVAAYKFLKENTNLPDSQISHLIIKRAGSPDFWEKGNLDFIYNNIFWFSNAGKEGIRAAIEAAKENPGSYTFKTAWLDILPKLLQWAATVGLFGTGLQKMFENIPERDKANYLTIPIGKTADNKTVYLVQPHDFQGQVFSGFLYQMLRQGKASEFGDILDYMAGGLPYTGVNPLLGLGADWKQYLTGRNPYDPFRGKYVMPEKVFTAGGTAALKEMGKYSSNQLGGGIVYRFKGKNTKEINNELEKILGFPFVGNILGRFVRVSDRGRSDLLDYTSRHVRKDRAKELIAMDDVIAEHLSKSKNTSGLKELYDNMVKGGTIKRHKFNEFLERAENTNIFRKGSPEAKALLNAESNEEKYYLIKQILENRK